MADLLSRPPAVCPPATGGHSDTSPVTAALTLCGAISRQPDIQSTYVCSGSGPGSSTTASSLLPATWRRCALLQCVQPVLVCIWTYVPSQKPSCCVFLQSSFSSAPPCSFSSLQLARCSCGMRCPLAMLACWYQTRGGGLFLIQYTSWLILAREPVEGYCLPATCGVGWHVM